MEGQTQKEFGSTLDLSNFQWDSKEYAEYLKKHLSDISKQGQGFKIPDDEVSYQRTTKKLKNDSIFNLKSKIDMKSEPLLSKVASFYTDTDHSISFKYTKYSEYPVAQLEDKQIPNLLYENDVAAVDENNFKLGSVQNLFTAEEEANEASLDKIGVEAISKLEFNVMNKEVRISRDIVTAYHSRASIFSGYDVPLMEDEMGLNEKMRKIVVRLQSVEWQNPVGNQINLVGYMFLLDLNSGKRVSECFKFCTPASCSGSFDVSNPHPDIALVLYLDKPFEGDLSEWNDHFVKGKISSSKAISNYRQPLGWYAIFPFDENVLGENPQFISQDIWTDWVIKYEDGKWSHEDLISMCLTLKKSGAKKFKQGPTRIQLKLEEVKMNDKIENCLELEDLNENQFAVYKQHVLKHHIYIWPLTANLVKSGAKVKNVSIKIQIVSNDVLKDASRLLNVIYGVGGEKLDCWNTAINYHNKSPSFVDEIKADLPLPLSQSHHILFTFYHVSFKNKRDDTIIGYAVQPLFVDGSLVQDQELKLPVFTDLIDKYLGSNASIKYVDNAKPCFNVKLKISTSFYSQSSPLASFINLCSAAEYPEDQTQKGLEALIDIDPVSLAKFWPVVLNSLFEHITESKINEALKKKAFKTVVVLLGKYTLKFCRDITDTRLHDQGLKKHSIAENYCKNSFHHFSSWKSRLFEQIPPIWNSLIREQDPIVKDSAKYSWFIFDIISKDLILFAYENKKLDELMCKRGQIIPEIVHQKLGDLLTSLSQEVYRLSKTALNIGKELNNGVANFLLQIFSCCSTTFVTDQIWDHLNGFDPAVAIHHHVKLDFLKIVCGYEHAISFSFAHAKIPDDVKHLDSLNSRHFFPCILQHAVFLGLSSKQEEIRVKCLQTLQQIIGKLEVDSRYNDEAKSRIFVMFLPLLAFSCDMVIRFTENTSTNEQFTVSEKNALVPVLTTVLRYLDHATLVKWLYLVHDHRFTQFIALLDHIGLTFQYGGKFKIMEQTASKGTRATTDNAKKFIENSYKLGAAQGSNLRELRGTLKAQGAVKKNTLKGTQKISSMPESLEQNDANSDRDFKIAGLQYHEICLVILNLNSSFFEVSKTSRSKIACDGVFFILANILKLPQNQVSAWTSLKLLAKVTVEHHRIILKNNKICSEICRLLLKHMASPFKDIRGISAELIYLLLKYNHQEYRGSVGKVKTQLTVAISQRDNSSPLDMKRGLVVLAQYPLKDTSCPKTLATHITNIVDSLTNILRDQLRMKVHKNDPEMLADMMFNLAAGYVNTPDLRIAILESLSNLHESHGFFCEAAFCKLHIAALVSEYLKYKSIKYGGPEGSKVFKNCNSNLTEEFFAASDINPDEEGICQSPIFSEFGLMETLNQSLSLLRKSQLFESAIEIHKLIIPIYERNRDHEALVQQYGNMKELYENIVAYTGRRILATYFHVSLFGTKFGSLDGKEFIYKEKTVTQLSEIVFRLSEIYKNKYGDAFELVNDSAKFAQIKKGPKDKAYLYITFVEPYFEEAALKERMTYFEKMHEITEFVSEKPYTKEGKAHGDLDAQYKKKTIVKTEKSFPYVKKRLLVVSTREIDLTPIEVSIEAIADRAEKLKTAIKGKPLTLKNIQLVLQGVVRPQVNSGPLSIASAFLEHEKISRFKKEHVTSLKSKFRELSMWCEQGVKLSKLHSSEDQLEYNKDLEEGFNLFRNKLEPLIEDLHDRRESKTLDTALQFLKDASSKSPGNTNDLAAVERFFNNK